MTPLTPRSLPAFLLTLITVAWYVVALALALAACLAIATPFIHLGNAELGLPVAFSIDAPALKVAAPSLGLDGAVIDEAHGVLRFPVPSARALLGPFVMLIVMLAAGLWALSELRAVFRTLRDDRPFVPANAARLRRLAFVVIGAELMRVALTALTVRYATSAAAPDGLRITARPDVNVLALLLGLIILAIAEVFRAGTRLDEEQSLTI
jgi:Protein of unknown function (DUF2975)